MRSVHAICAVAVAVLFGAACAGRPVTAPPADSGVGDRETYVIGVTDVLTINVWGNQDLSQRVPVRPDGKISVPLLDDVPAAGLTPMELKEVLTREFSEYVSNPHVTVIVSEMNSQTVSVMGEVARQATIPLTRDLRVLEAIALVGGFSNFADRGDVRVVRRNADGTEQEFRFDYDAYIKGNAPGTNMLLQAGDTIIVPD
jgi:polysaccharide export outer membrane protein